IERYECDRSGIYLWLKVNMIAVGSRRGNPLGYQCTTILLSMYKDIRPPTWFPVGVRLLVKY
ncbi:hypothetical protein, partial [Limnospira sp. PMC 289.06]|uniref:hypothetical protein n=1 Tax=Limnospira sp. PMC 289.06 TaxID=2981094 RepID=UPI0028EABFF0